MSTNDEPVRKMPSTQQPGGEAPTPPDCPDEFADAMRAARFIANGAAYWGREKVLARALLHYERELAEEREEVQRLTQMVANAANELASRSASAESKAEAAILDHNRQCKQQCEARYKGGACSYRDPDGKQIYPPRVCHDCPTEYRIEWPVSSRAESVEAFQRAFREERVKQASDLMYLSGEIGSAPTRVWQITFTDATVRFLSGDAPRSATTATEAK